MTKQYYMKKADQLLKNAQLYRTMLENMNELETCGGVPLRKAKTARLKKQYTERILHALTRAMALLTPTERQIIELCYFSTQKELTFFDICEACALERSAVFRHKAEALDKIGKAVFGV